MSESKRSKVDAFIRRAVTEQLRASAFRDEDCFSD